MCCRQLRTSSAGRFVVGPSCPCRLTQPAAKPRRLQPHRHRLQACSWPCIGSGLVIVADVEALLLEQIKTKKNTGKTHAHASAVDEEPETKFMEKGPTARCWKMFDGFQGAVRGMAFHTRPDGGHVLIIVTALGHIVSADLLSGTKTRIVLALTSTPAPTINAKAIAN